MFCLGFEPGTQAGWRWRFYSAITVSSHYWSNNGHLLASFFFIYVFSTQLKEKEWLIKVCRWLDSNHGSLVSEMTSTNWGTTTAQVIIVTCHPQTEVLLSEQLSNWDFLHHSPSPPSYSYSSFVACKRYCWWCCCCFVVVVVAVAVEYQMADTAFARLCPEPATAAAAIEKESFTAIFSYRKLNFRLFQ